jgi:hypothetical protein
MSQPPFQNPQLQSPAIHHVGQHFTTPQRVTMIAALVTVLQPEQLAGALGQREKAVVIEHVNLAREFSRIAYWQEARWWFIAALVYRLLTFAIAHQYQIGAEWHLNWKVQTLDGKITLTPVQKSSSTPNTLPNSDPINE